MRKEPKKVTPAGIAEVKEVKAKYPDMSAEMIGKLCDFSDATVYKILRGEYDKKPATAKSDDSDMALAVMELSELAERQNALIERQNALIERQNALTGVIALALAVIIDPKSGKTSMPVADAIRQAVRGEKQ